MENFSRFLIVAPCVREEKTSCYFCMCMHFACCIAYTIEEGIYALLAKRYRVTTWEENGVLTRVTSHGPVFIFDPVIAACDSDIRRLPIFAPATESE